MLYVLNMNNIALTVPTTFVVVVYTWAYKSQAFLFEPSLQTYLPKSCYVFIIHSYLALNSPLIEIEISKSTVLAEHFM